MSERMPMENPSESAPSAEGREIIELREEFAQELKTPHEGSYFKKLQRIAGAFVLAGVAVLGSDRQATAPELSDEFLEVTRYSSMDQMLSAGKVELYRKTLKAISDKGGISISPQVPETVYKVFPYETARQARTKAQSMEVPYFSKPEVILGEKFIKENPEKAKEYMEKIGKGLRASFVVRTADGSGSGVIVDAGKRKLFLTAAHVVGDKVETNVELISGLSYPMGVIFKDEKRDLAILEFPEIIAGKLEDINSAEASEKVDKILEENGASSVKVAEEGHKLKKGDSIGFIGNPVGFPFEAFIGKYEKSEPYKYRSKSHNSDYESIEFKPDERFKILSLFENKAYDRAQKRGEVINGMSGGPALDITNSSEPKLVALNTVSPISLADFPKYAPYFKKNGIDKDKAIREGGGVSHNEIRKFIKNYTDALELKK